MGIRTATGAFFIAITVLVLHVGHLYAKTTVDSTQNPKFTGVKLATGQASRFAKEFQKRVDANGPYFCNSFYLQNVLGYAVGSPHIDKMDFGIVTGFAESNGSYFAGTADKNSYPGVTPIATLRFGMGLSPESDVLVKLTIFDLYMINQEPDVSDIKIDDYRQFAIGGKYRYFMFGPQRLLPFLFNFEGVSVGAGGDLMTGYLGVVGDYENDMDRTSIDPGTGTPKEVDTYIKGDYNAMMRMLQLTASVEAVSYFNVINIFTFYTGCNLSLGWSWFGFEADSNGNLMAKDDTLDADIGNGFDYRSDYLVNLDYDSDTIFNPFPLMPVYVAGIELDALAVKLGLETAVNFVNREDVALQLSIRYEL